MDKTLHNHIYSGISRSPFAGSRTRQSSASSYSASGRKSYYAGIGASPLGTSKKAAGQSRFSVSGRSNQSIVGIRSECSVVESYGFQLPVLVNEALTFSEKNQCVSVTCSQNGWAWVVHGRRLLIWQYKDTRHSGGSNSPPRAKDLVRTPQRRAAMAQCRELTLPHCDIGHKATLISVFISDGQQMASCLAVSPTGDVRYWPSIAHDGSTVDVTGILDGQEFDKLLEVPPQQGYLLVTTTCSLVFLQLQLVNGRHVLHHKTIRQPSGFLGGIGKKFASIIIGMNSSNDKENKLVSVQSESTPDRSAVITVLADRWLQRWHIANNGGFEQLIFEDSDIVRKLRDEFHQKFWSGRAESIEVDMHLLDMHINEGKLYVLAGAVNTTHTPQMHYGITTLMATSESARILNFVPLKMSHFFSAGTEQDCLMFRFLICRSHMYLYNDKVIYPLNLSNESMVDIEAEKIEFHQQDDRIMSASVSAHLPLFFSRTHGLVCVTPSDFDSSDMLNMSVNVGDPYSQLVDYSSYEQPTIASSANENNLVMFDLDPDTIYNDFKDEVSQLKAAFVYRLKRNNTMSNTILNELFKNISETQTGLGNETTDLDRIVITIAEDLAEDIPAADPRWEQLWDESASYKHALGSSSSLQILTQLKEKNLALRHFIEFLHSTGIINKLTAVPIGGGSILKPTCYVLSDINEKIIASIALKSIQAKFPKIIDEAINSVVTMRKETTYSNLTAQDVFYVRVCKFQDFFYGLSEVLDSRIESQQQISIGSFIADVNSIVLNILHEVIAFREQSSALYTLPADKVESYEFLPWTAMSGNVGVRDALSRFVDMSVKYGARSNTDVELKQKFHLQILELMDFILDGRKNYLDSIRDSEKYSVLLQQFESLRRDLISILIEDSQYEFAAKLAEKYLDFHSLVVMCDETNNQDRLDMYIEKYEEYEFSQFAINWHLRQNRQGEVFERFKGNPAALSQFMRDHPTLGWIQQFFNGDFERASKTLFQLARNETEFVQRKKSMLSLAKLAAFASADSDLTAQVEKINSELNVVAYQEQLSEPLLTAFGYDFENQKVLKIEEIINLFISEENENANEYDFRQALELLSYMDEPLESRHKIWCAAILRDNWIDYDTNSSIDYLQNLLFFKLIEVSHLMDGDFENFLPPIEDFLNSTDLGNLVHNKSFEYLLKLTYEYIADSYNKSNDMDM